MDDKMVTVVVVRNPFDKQADREIHYCDYIPGTDVRAYTEPYTGAMHDILMSYNGEIVEMDKSEYYVPNPGDCVAVCEGVHGGGDKNPLAIIASIALTVWTGGIAQTGIWGVAGNTFMSGVIAAGLTYLGGLVINSLFPPPSTDYGNSSESTSSYGWSTPSSVTGQGGALAITYGTVNTAGTIISHHIIANGSNQYLNMLLCGGQGAASKISNIKIDGNPISYYDNVTTAIRYGYNVQDSISLFDVTTADTPLNFELDSSWSTCRTEGDGGSGLEVAIEFPSGLYRFNDKGKLRSTYVTIEIAYKLVSATEWSYYAGGAFNITGATTSALSYQYRINNIPTGQYDVRVRCAGKAGTSTQYGNKVYWSQLSHLIYDKFCHPNKIMIGIQALATSQLSGSLPTVTWDQTVESVYAYNPNTKAYETKDASNAAWVCYDILHKCRYLQHPVTGKWMHVIFGCDVSEIDYQAFANWAARCELMKLYFNYQYNSTSDLWEALKKPETVGRGKVILKGTVFSCVFEAPSTPAQLFTDSNIYMNTLTEEFASLKDRANCVEVSFLNKDKNYDRDVVAVYGSSWNDSADNSTQITLDGCTEYEQAYRHGYHLLKQTECFVRTMEFTADVDAIACQVGDSILFQHSLLKYGLTRGRTNSLITLNSMTFNEDVILKPDTDYVVMFRLMDDTFVEKHIQAVSELTQTNIVRFTSPFTTVPPEGCLFACGEVGKVVKPLKVVNISRSSGNLKRKITALEFSDDLYNEASSIPKIDYTTSNVTLASFTAEEDGYSQSDGTHISEIDVKYKLFNPNKELLKVQILVQKDEGDWEAFKVSSSQEASLTLSNVRVGSTYAFRLRVYSYMGIPLTGWITSNTVTVTGKKDSDPTDITSIVAAQRNDSIVIDGVIVKDVDFAGIEIRVDGDTWSRAQKINTLFTDFPITINGVFDGTHIIRAKSVDNIGNRSMNDATYIINVTGVNHYKNIVLERNDVDSLGSLTLSNLVIAGNTLIAPSGITYGDYSTYGDLPLPYYVQAVTGSLTASLISQPIDTYKVGRTGINFDFGWSISDVNATYGTIGDRTYGDYIQDTYGNVTTEGNVNIYISFCDDLVNGTWTDWQMYLGGEYIFRYIKYKVDIEWESVNTKPVLSKLKQYYDVPDVTLSKVVEVPVDGLTINFNAEGLDFYFTPSSITTTVINGNGNVFPEVTAVSAESITIKCYNKLGESVIGNILVVCKGY